MRQYLDHSRLILSDEFTGYKPNRTGVDTVSRFGYQAEYDLSKGFPLMTTKRMPFKHVAAELLWFMSGDTNIKTLVDQGVHIWDRNAFQYWARREGVQDRYPLYSSAWHRGLEEFVGRIKDDEAFARENGTLGEVYGKQWRHWKTSDGKEIDQLSGVIDLLRNNPASRRIILTAWNPEEVPKMALPPCHSFVQFNVQDGRLDCAMYQRSCDMFLGVPFNVASYALFTSILAKEAGLRPGRFVHSLGDAHFYCGRGERGAWYKENLDLLKESVGSIDPSRPADYASVLEWINGDAPAEKEGEEGLDHVTGILEQLQRAPRKLPKIVIPDKSWDKLTATDIGLKDYDPAPSIKRAMAA